MFVHVCVPLHRDAFCVLTAVSLDLMSGKVAEFFVKRGCLIKNIDPTLSNNMLTWTLR